MPMRNLQRGGPNSDTAPAEEADNSTTEETVDCEAQGDCFNCTLSAECIFQDDVCRFRSDFAEDEIDENLICSDV